MRVAAAAFAACIEGAERFLRSQGAKPSEPSGEAQSCMAICLQRIGGLASAINSSSKRIGEHGAVCVLL